MAKSKGKVGETLNVNDIVKAISERSKEAGKPVSQTDVHTVLNLLRDVTSDALAEGQKVMLTGFISITPSYRNPRKGNNVITNKPMDIPECVVATVKAGKQLRDATKGMSKDLIKAVKEA